MSEETMKSLNKDVYNRIYSELYYNFLGSYKERERLEKMINFLAMYGKDWDEPKKLRFEEF